MVLTDLRNTKDNIGERDTTKTLSLKRNKEKITLIELSTIFQTTNIGGDTLIWGNANFGIWNQYKWGNSSNTSFILGNIIAGVLGTSKLGSQASSLSTIRVLNPSDTYQEYFRDIIFQSGTGDGVWDTTNHLLEFSSGSSQDSEIIALNGENYNQATFFASGSTTDVLTANISFDDGTKWVSGSFGTTLSGTASSSGIKWRIDAGGSGTVTYIKIEYS